MKRVTILIVVLAMGLMGIMPALAGTKVVVGYTQAPQSTVGKTVAEFRRLAEQYSGGDLELQVYPSSQLGTFGEMVTQMKVGICNVIFIQPDALGQQVAISTANSWPFIFKDQDEMLSAWNGPGGQALISEVEKLSGYRMIGPTWNEARWIYTTRAAGSLKDLKGMKIRVPGTDIYVNQMRLLGLSSTPMNIREVYTAMQQGVVEGIEGALADMAGFSLQDVTKTVVTTGHVLSPKAWLTWGEWVDKLSAKNKAAFLKAAKEASAYYGKILQAEEETIKGKFLDKGVRFVEPGVSWQELRKMVEPLKKQLPNIWIWAEKLQQT